uniref:ATP synthase F0 subunit 8 n=1 Tax=Parascaris equorum TaxID=6256 RepID=A0A914R0P0_PAREQ
MLAKAPFGIIFQFMYVAEFIVLIIYFVLHTFHFGIQSVISSILGASDNDCSTS